MNAYLEILQKRLEIVFGQLIPVASDFGVDQFNPGGMVTILSYLTHVVHALVPKNLQGIG
jgi:hypothetical protein